MRRLRARLAASALLLASPAFGQPSTDAGVATELFNAGRDLMKENDFAAACPKLAESARLDARVGTLARLAECEEKIGQLVGARAHWQQALNLARVQKDARSAHVESELARVDGIVPKIKLAMAGDAPADLAIKVDDLQVGAGSLGIALPVQPGSHKVIATATGKQPWSMTVVTRADGAVTSVSIPALADESKPTGSQPTAVDTAQPPPSAPSPSPLRVIGPVTAAVGVVGIGVGVAFGVIAKQKLDDSNAQPGGCDAANNCPPQATGTRNDARTAGNVSTALFIAGGALTAAGITIWLLGPRRPAGAASVSAAPVVGLGSLGFSMRGGF